MCFQDELRGSRATNAQQSEALNDASKHSSTLSRKQRQHPHQSQEPQSRHAHHHSNYNHCAADVSDESRTQLESARHAPDEHRHSQQQQQLHGHASNTQPSHLHMTSHDDYASEGEKIRQERRPALREPIEFLVDHGGRSPARWPARRDLESRPALHLDRLSS